MVATHVMPLIPVQLAAFPRCVAACLSLLVCVATLWFGAVCATARAGESLEEAYRLAVAQDPILRASVADTRAQQAAIGESRARLLPQLQLQLSYSRIDQSGNFNGVSVNHYNDFDSLDYQAVLQQSLFSLPDWHQWAASRATGRRAEVSLRAARESLILRVANAYFGILRARDNLASARAEAKTLREQSAKVDRRFASGLVLATEVLEARAAADLAAVNRLVNEDNLATARESLRVITGYEHGQLWSLKADFPALGPKPSALDPWLAWALHDNADLLAAEHALAAARRELSAARSRWLPTLSGSVQYGFSELDGRFQTLALDQNYDGYTVALQMTAPIYRGGAFWAQKKRVHQQFMQARATLDGRRREIARQLRAQFASAGILERQVRARQRSLVSARQALRSVRHDYETGTRDLIDVLNRETTLYAAQRNHSDARYDLILSLLQLKALSGQLTDEDLVQLNGWLTPPTKH